MLEAGRNSRVGLDLVISVDPMDTTARPIVEPPTGDAPEELLIEDLVDGDGPVAAAGSNVAVDYVGVAHSDGTEFDASWNRGQTLDFRLGAGMVIQGWDQGVQGMKVGGRRKLTIPPHLAYGDQGAGGVIAPGETLIFIVDLRAVS
jgi:peptidylprolyl isomerase